MRTNASMWLKERLSNLGLSVEVHAHHIVLNKVKFNYMEEDFSPLYTNEQLIRMSKEELIVLANMFGFSFNSAFRRMKIIQYKLEKLQGKELVFALNLYKKYKVLLSGTCMPELAHKAILKDFIYTNPINHYPKIILERDGIVYNITNIIRVINFDNGLKKIMSQIFDLDWSPKKELESALKLA